MVRSSGPSPTWYAPGLLGLLRWERSTELTRPARIDLCDPALVRVLLCEGLEDTLGHGGAANVAEADEENGYLVRHCGMGGSSGKKRGMGSGMQKRRDCKYSRSRHRLNHRLLRIDLSHPAKAEGQPDADSDKGIGARVRVSTGHHHNVKPPDGVRTSFCFKGDPRMDYAEEMMTQVAVWRSVSPSRSFFRRCHRHIRPLWFAWISGHSPPRTVASVSSLGKRAAFQRYLHSIWNHPLF